MRNRVLLLIFIVLAAVFFRFFQLGSNPPSLTWDEVAWGYNAYTLSFDGRDEFGRFLPYDYFESFGDFKPPVYAYLTVLPVVVFGLTEFATRFPSALFGSLSVLITYFLIREMFYKSKRREALALMGSFLLAISPWHIMLSRAAFEANVASTFVIAGVLFFLVSLRKNRWYLLFSALFFVLSMYTFNSARIVAPLLALVLFAGFYKDLLQRKKELFVSAVLGFFLLLPIAGFLVSPQASLRFKEVNIFTDKEVIEFANQQIENNNSAWWSKIIHNRRVGFAKSFISHYTDNLNTDFLFIKGDGNLKFSTQDVGQMYLWEFPFVIAGILFLIKRREGVWWLPFAWIAIALFPSGVARETPHALRIENALPMFQLLTAFGISEGFLFVKKYKKLRTAFSAITIALVAVFLGIFTSGLFVHYPRESSREWQYGYKEAILYALQNEEQYDEIRMTSQLGRPHMYVAFYTHMNPDFYRKTAEVNRDPFGFVEVKKVGKYVFSHTDESMHTAPTDGRRVLVIDLAEKIPEGSKNVKEFKLLNGEGSLAAYSFNK